jgi:hypothetical protein
VLPETVVGNGSVRTAAPEDSSSGDLVFDLISDLISDPKEDMPPEALTHTTSNPVTAEDPTRHGGWETRTKVATAQGGEATAAPTGTVSKVVCRVV